MGILLSNAPHGLLDKSPRSRYVRTVRESKGQLDVRYPCPNVLFHVYAITLHVWAVAGLFF